MKKKTVFIIATVILFISLGGAFFYRQKTKPLEYQFTTVKKGKLSLTVSSSGEIQTDKEVTLQFQTSGKLAWIGVKEGDKVKQWQAIASLDVRELEKKLKKELNDYLKERWDFEGDRETYHVSTDDLDKYTLTNAVRRLLEKNQFDLENTVWDVEIAHLAVELATIISPIAGIVTKAEAPNAGVNVTPATSRITISSPDEVYFEANVDENDIGLVKLGQKAIVFLDAYPDEEFQGEVKEISFVSTTTSGGGTAFPVQISLGQSNENEKFKIGMNGDVEIIISEKESAFYLPQEAVKQKEGKKYVEILKDGTVEKIKVTTGLETDTEIEIVEGVEEGEEVIAEKTKNKK